MFFLATSDATGQPSCLYNGGGPGFVRVVDPGTIAFPSYIRKYAPGERSSFVPESGCATPIPSWKKGDWASDVLPENDPARGK
jgi:hypothetical protein